MKAAKMAFDNDPTAGDGMFRDATARLKQRRCRVQSYGLDGRIIGDGFNDKTRSQAINRFTMERN